LKLKIAPGQMNQMNKKTNNDGINNDIKQNQQSIENRKNTIINEELKKLILFYIDYDELKKKSRNALNTNCSNNKYSSLYYLLNYDWFYKIYRIK
jgi:hypothetical protein